MILNLNDQVLGKEPELLLDPVRVEDGGNYTCHASNELGHALSSPVTVNTFCELPQECDQLVMMSCYRSPRPGQCQH